MMWTHRRATASSASRTPALPTLLTATDEPPVVVEVGGLTASQDQVGTLVTYGLAVTDGLTQVQVSLTVTGSGDDAPPQVEATLLPAGDTVRLEGQGAPGDRRGAVVRGGATDARRGGPAGAAPARCWWWSRAGPTSTSPIGCVFAIRSPGVRPAVPCSPDGRGRQVWWSPRGSCSPAYWALPGQASGFLW